MALGLGVGVTDGWLVARAHLPDAPFLGCCYHLAWNTRVRAKKIVIKDINGEQLLGKDQSPLAPHPCVTSC